MALPVPYFQDEQATIYLGDCREILPLLEPVDLVLTDPPYGIGAWSHTGSHRITEEQANDCNKWDVRPDKATFDLILSKGEEVIIWGGNYFSDLLGPCRAPIVWDKKQRGMHYAEGEIAFTNFNRGTLRIFEYAIVGGETFGCKVHPTQKPIPVITFAINQAKKSSTILDPYMGSGTTLIAAKNLGRKAIGIELEEKYCRAAVNRLRQGVLF